MDYKTIINQLNTFKSEFIDYFNERKLKNDKDVANIIDTYLVSLENKNVSLQAFKTRIIHNGHSVEKLIPIIKNRVISLAVDLGGREDYEKISNSQTVSPTKKADLFLWSQAQRKKRQEANNRINTLNRDYKQKQKDNEEKLQESLKVYQQNIADFTKEMNKELGQIETKMNEEYREIDLVLLNENNLSEIKKLKTQLNNIYKKGFHEQFVCKCSHLTKIREEQMLILTETEKQSVIDKQLDFETEIELNNQKLKLETLRYEDIAKDFLYDLEKESQNCDSILEKKLACLELIKNHNDKLMNYEDVGIVFENLIIRLSEIIIVCKISNQYNPYCRVIEAMIDLIVEIKDLFESCFNSLNDKIVQYRDNIFAKFDEISRYIAYKRHRSKENIKENINDCLTLLYNNEARLYDNYLDVTYQLLMQMQSQLDVIFQADISRLQYNKLLLTQANYEFDIYKFGYEKINIKDETQKETLLSLYSNLQERIKAHSVTAHAVYDVSMDDIDHRCRVFIKKNSKAIRKLETENKKRTVVINKTVQRLLKNRNHSIKYKQKRLFKEFNDHIKKEERVLRNKLRLLT
ncbi:MAG TPA: hypothetical protein PKG96_01975 [Bacilli bacterium]|jgi:hypothetical protein|nr:hypothetical protein [Acholeplasmataceae bacterium]HNZ77179.1 hypothetical protein [Bacilli bacterium]HOD60866.1 hypothetical protein [Bacilli bacterium]HOH61534.1 hypothetical protein [Bacilli bacterium]HPM14432.1 hypothetical protein [Bacilli bacterium]